MKTSNLNNNDLASKCIKSVLEHVHQTETSNFQSTLYKNTK